MGSTSVGMAASNQKGLKPNPNNSDTERVGVQEPVHHLTEQMGKLRPKGGGICLSTHGR